MPRYESMYYGFEGWVAVEGEGEYRTEVGIANECAALELEIIAARHLKLAELYRKTAEVARKNNIRCSYERWRSYKDTLSALDTFLRVKRGENCGSNGVEIAELYTERNLAQTLRQRLGQLRDEDYEIAVVMGW